MNQRVFFIYVIIIFIDSLISGHSSSTPTNTNPIVQRVKTCCGNSEVFEISTKECVSLKNTNLNVTTKLNSLYPYFGNWKRKKTPEILYEPPVCGYENYKIVDTKKKIALNGMHIEMSEIRRKRHKVITSFSFEYFEDYCIELVANGSKSYNGTDLRDVIRISCNPVKEHTKSIVKLCCPFKEIYDNETNSCVKSRKIDAYTILDDVPRYPSFQYNSDNSATPNHDIQTTFVFGDKSKHNYSIECLLWQNLKIERKELILFDNGNIDIEDQIYNHKEYCINDATTNIQ